MRIVSVKFQDSIHRYGDKEAMATLENGEEKFVFAWFSDELYFQESELVGLTIKQARELRTARDIAYLQS